MKWRSSDRIRTRLRNNHLQAIRGFSEINGLDHKNEVSDDENAQARLRALGKI